MTATPERPGGPTEEGFLRQIWEHPEDDGLRQVYADWLLERGDPRGEFLTLQYARLEGPLPPESSAREEALLADHRAQWLGPLADDVEHPTARFERGFAADVQARAVDDSPAWATIATLRRRVPRDDTPMPVLRRLLEIASLSAFSGRTRPLPVEELEWTGAYLVPQEKLRERLDLLPDLPHLRRLDLRQGLGPKRASFFEWIWQSRIGARISDLALGRQEEPFGEWLALMDAHEVTRLELGLFTRDSVVVGGAGPRRDLLFDRTVRRASEAEAFARAVAEVLRQVPAGSIGDVEIRLGDAALPPQSERRLRFALPGRGFQRVRLSAGPGTGAWRDLL